MRVIKTESHSYPIVIQLNNNFNSSYLLIPSQHFLARLLYMCYHVDQDMGYMFSSTFRLNNSNISYLKYVAYLIPGTYIQVRYAVAGATGYLKILQYIALESLEEANYDEYEYIPLTQYRNVGGTGSYNVYKRIKEIHKPVAVQDAERVGLIDLLNYPNHSEIFDEWAFFCLRIAHIDPYSELPIVLKNPNQITTMKTDVTIQINYQVRDKDLFLNWLYSTCFVNEGMFPIFKTEIFRDSLDSKHALYSLPNQCTYQYDKGDPFKNEIKFNGINYSRLFDNQHISEYVKPYEIVQGDILKSTDTEIILKCNGLTI